MPPETLCSWTLSILRSLRGPGIVIGEGFTASLSWYTCYYETRSHSCGSLVFVLSLKHMWKWQITLVNSVTICGPATAPKWKKIPTRWRFILVGLCCLQRASWCTPRIFHLFKHFISAELQQVSGQRAQRSLSQLPLVLSVVCNDGPWKIFSFIQLQAASQLY